jgi:hypothetical protein
MLVFLSIQYEITIARQRKIPTLGLEAIRGSFIRELLDPIIKNAHTMNGMDRNIKGFNQKAAETFPFNNWCNALNVPHPGQ